MAEAVVSFVVESLGNLLIQEAKLLHGVGGKVDQICHELRLMQAFLRDADSRQNEDERIRVWVAEIKSLSYDAGDVLESYILGVESRKKGGFKNVLKRYVCIVDECIVNHKVSSKIDDIRTAITALSTSLHTYGIRSLSEVREGLTSADEIRGELRRSYSHVDEDDFIALEGEVENLVDLLVNDEDGDKYYQVVSIYGMGGLGKTTIAKKVYKHARVKSHFAAFAWVCISQQWQKRDVLQKILKSLIPEIGEQIPNLEDNLIKKIFDVQQNKKCLVILDDIWSVDDWNRLRPAFPIGNMQSKLLLTSRNVEVVTHADPNGFLYQPRVLVDDECLELLQKKAFKRRLLNDATDVEEMENLGRQMVKHCGGLPLAVILLGGLLATKHSLREWQMVHHSIRSYLRKGEGMGHHLHGGVSDILALSYYDLPCQLKPCFLYLAQFSEDSEIEAEVLYQLWIAESLVLSKDRGEGETMMNVAERYLGELAHRCMIQVQLEEEESRFRIYKSCNMHDLMRDLCMLKAKEEDFFHAVGFGVRNDPELDDSSSSSTIGNRTRRLVICYDDEDSSSRHVSVGKKTSQHIRSLIFLNPSEEYEGRRMPRIIRSDLKDFKLLRVLVVDGLIPDHLKFYWAFQSPYESLKTFFNFVSEYRTIPKAIGSLIHLKYLSFSSCIFCTFPAFLTNLKHLQTLKLTDCKFEWFCHQRLQKRGRLRHIYLPEVPSFVRKTTKLRLDDLCNLEVLENFDPSWCNAEDLTKLTNLRKLTVRGSINHEDLERIVHYLITVAPYCLQYSSLEIKLADFPSENLCVVLSQLLGCHNLHQLSIERSLGDKLQLTNHDHRFNFSSSLTKLSLKYSHLKEDPMPSLGSFPNLRILHLLDHSFVGKEIVCSAMGFSQLETLILDNLLSLQKWRVEKGALPKLSHLRISSCLNLEKLPDGLRFVTTLRELEIGPLMSTIERRVRVGGEDFYKIQHVPSIRIHHY